MLGSSAVGAIQVKGVPADVHEAARVRAKTHSQTLSDYVLELIKRDLDKMARQQWLDRVRALGPGVPDDVDIAELIREARELASGGPPDGVDSRS